MRASVASAFVAFSTRFEGALPFMYTDAENLVTTGIGNLVDASGSGSPTPWAPALSCGWVNPDGSPADQATIIAQWQAVKAGGVNSSVNAGHLTTIRLPPEAIARLVDEAVAVAEHSLRQGFPGYDSWPADGQLALLSMAWAMGGDFWRGFPAFTAAVNAGRFADAAPPLALGHYKGVGVQARIAAGDLLWQNAQAVVDGNLDPETLWYPKVAPTGILALASAALTIAAPLLAVGLGAAALARPEWMAAMGESALRLLERVRS